MIDAVYRKGLRLTKGVGMSRMGRIACGVAATAALVVGFGGASAYASVSADHRPPKLPRGEEWSYVFWEFFGNCNRPFGEFGTQVCDPGAYKDQPAPRPEFGRWDFHNANRGTSKATALAGQKGIHLNFYVQDSKKRGAGAEILGEIPSANSERYTVTSSQGPNAAWRIESPSHSAGYDFQPPGEKGGPLHLTVEHYQNVYDFEVFGWVVVVKKG